MDDPLEQGKWLVEKIRTFVGIFRNSPTEIVTATFAVICFSAATFLLGQETVKAILPSQLLGEVQIGLFAIGGLLIAWTVFRIWKQAIPSQLPPPETRPAAIKGPMPFTREDGEVFR